MPRSKSKRGKYEKVVNWKKPKEEHQELNEGFDDDRIEEARENQQPRALFKLSKRHGYEIEHSTAKRTLKVDEDDNAKAPVGSTRKTQINHRKTRLARLFNPSYRKPTPPKKKSCCERWFGRDAGKKKCKKKCKTRKKKKKSKTLKKKRRRRKKRTKKR